MAFSQYAIPDTPRVISPSPTLSDASARDGYFPKTNGRRLSTHEPISEDGEASSSDPELQRARSKSRSPMQKKTPRRVDAVAASTVDVKPGLPPVAASKPIRRKPEPLAGEKSTETNGHLSPQSVGFGARYWRELSRSPSPFGLIPIHREWRTFVHRHEIPRKAMHVSIGFLVLWLYRHGVQTSAIHPKLLTALIPIFAVDITRMHYPPLNRLYIRLLGAFMRESEAHDKYNGVISYLGGAWFVLYFCAKDVGVVSILLLAWCDSAASTFGRLWGRYTPRIRKGKSLAGSLAACVFGIGTAVLFWAVIAPSVPQSWNQGPNAFAFDGHLTLPLRVRESLGWTKDQAKLVGLPALAVMSVVSGLIVSVSEAIDIFGLDDNLTIPILCGIALSAFLAAFGSAAS